MDLIDLYEEYRADPKFDVLRERTSRLVEGRGNHKSPIAMVIGEAPGATEETKGKPFVGQSGKLLDGLMGLAGLGPDEVWITNAVKYRPVFEGRNRTPFRWEIEASAKYLRKEWKAVNRPPLLITCGGVPLKAILKTTSIAVSNHIGGLILLRDDLALVAMFHPAFPLRQRSLIPIVESQWEKMQPIVKAARQIRKGDLEKWPGDL